MKTASKRVGENLFTHKTSEAVSTKSMVNVERGIESRESQRTTDKVRVSEHDVSLLTNRSASATEAQRS